MTYFTADQDVPWVIFLYFFVQKSTKKSEKRSKNDLKTYFQASKSVFVRCLHGEE